MSKVINLDMPVSSQGQKRSRSRLSAEEREEAARLGWNNRYCGNCGRPYSRPPTGYSIEEIEAHPLWPEWQLTQNCRKGNCGGVYLVRDFKPTSALAGNSPKNANSLKSRSSVGASRSSTAD